MFWISIYHLQALVQWRQSRTPPGCKEGMTHNTSGSKFVEDKILSETGFTPSAHRTLVA